MRHYLLITGLSAAVAVSAWACGSDVDTVPSTGGSGTTSGSGGMGGATATTTSTTTTSTTSGAGGFENLCEEACSKLENECGLPGGTCEGAFQQYLGISCGEREAECPSQCVLDASCGAVFSLLSNTPDPALTACLQGCGVAGECQTCLIGSCGGELNTCTNDPDCSEFLQCASACGSDQPCIEKCAVDHSSAATDDLVQCLVANCSDECLGAGGSGGMGGAGGMGGGS